jgi:hypothetical protein
MFAKEEIMLQLQDDGEENEDLLHSIVGNVACESIDFLSMLLNHL